MSPVGRTNDSASERAEAQVVEGRARRWLAAARARYEGSWVEAIVAQLKSVDFVTWTTVFAAELLWSALPFIILLSSLADERIDDDLSRHIGLNAQGAGIVRSLFRNSPAHGVVAIATGLLFTFAGVVAVVASLEQLYARVFDQAPRRWRNLPRNLIWIAVLLGLLIFEGATSGPERRAAGRVLQAPVTFVVAAVFFAWTMHFLLAGRVSWRRVVRPAVVTALLWVAFAFFSSAYFSSVVVSDSKTYGTIGVVFTVLTWFVIIGAVIVLGAVGGAVWQRRTTTNGRGPGDIARPARR